MISNTIELPILGKVTLENTDFEYKYQAGISEYDFKGKPVDLDVHFIELSQSEIDKVSHALNSIEQLDQIGLECIEKDYKNGGESDYYIREWYPDILEQIFTEEEFENYIKHTDNQKSIEERLLSKLRLVRVGVYAGSDNEFIVLDYAFGYELEKGFRDDMMVVKMDQDLKVCDISNEG